MGVRTSPPVGGCRQVSKKTTTYDTGQPGLLKPGWWAAGGGDRGLWAQVFQPTSFSSLATKGGGWAEWVPKAYFPSIFSAKHQKTFGPKIDSAKASPNPPPTSPWGPRGLGGLDPPQVHEKSLWSSGRISFSFPTGFQRGWLLKPLQSHPMLSN